MNAVLQKPRAKTSSGASSGSDWASVHGRYFAPASAGKLRTSHLPRRVNFDLRRRRGRNFAHSPPARTNTYRLKEFLRDYAGYNKDGTLPPDSRGARWEDQAEEKCMAKSK